MSNFLLGVYRSTLLAWAKKVRRIASRLLDRSWETSPAYLLSRCIVSPHAQIVQIGSNDGKTNDPLRKLLLSRRTWRALFVEPVPYLFDRLTRNYPSDPRFQFANVAVTTEKEAVFHWVDVSAKQHLDNLPPWFDQLGSFDRGHISKHLAGILEPFIVSAPVQCVTLPELLQHHAIHEITIFHIDAEGHDWKILSQLDLTTHSPDLIIFEHRHLIASDRRASQSFLAEQYDIYDLGRDYLAIAKSAKSIRRETLSFLSKKRIDKVNRR